MLDILRLTPEDLTMRKARPKARLEACSREASIMLGQDGP